MDNLQIIKNEYEKLKGQMVLSHFQVYQLVGIGDDEEDYYYLLYDGRKVKWSTCVGRITQLKGKIDDKDYNEMIHIANLNFNSSDDFWGAKSKDELVKMAAYYASIEHKQKMETLGHKETLIAGWCWDLN